MCKKHTREGVLSFCFKDISYCPKTTLSLLKSFVTANINNPAQTIVEITVTPKNNNKFGAPTNKALMDTQTLRIGINDKYH